MFMIFIFFLAGCNNTIRLRVAKHIYLFFQTPTAFQSGFAESLINILTTP